MSSIEEGLEGSHPATASITELASLARIQPDGDPDGVIRVPDDTELLYDMVPHVIEDPGPGAIFGEFPMR